MYICRYTHTYTFYSDPSFPITLKWTNMFGGFQFVVSYTRSINFLSKYYIYSTIIMLRRSNRLMVLLTELIEVDLNG